MDCSGLKWDTLVFTYGYYVLKTIIKDIGFIFGQMLGTAAMLLVMVWKPHVSVLSISAILR